MTPNQIKLAVGAALFLVLLVFIWVVFVPPYNVPKFENIDNNQTGFLVPLDQDTSLQAHFESAAYLADKKVAAKRVQIHRRWVQRGWLYTTGEYLDVERLIVVDRSPVIREWTDSHSTGSNPKDDSLSAQSKDGTGLKINMTCTAYIPNIPEKAEEPQGAEHFLYYYRGESLATVMDNEIRARAQAVAAEFCAQYPLETLRGTQHKLAEAVRDDVVPFFAKRGVAVTNIGLVGGFHYVNRDIQDSIDKAIQAQQLKVVATAQQQKEGVEFETKLQNQKIENQTIKLEAEGKAVALAAKLEGEAKARLAGAKVDAESAVVSAKGKADAIRLTADADAYRFTVLAKNQDLVIALETLKVEQAWKQQWTGSVPATIVQGLSGGVPIFPFNLDKVVPTATKPVEKK